MRVRCGITVALLLALTPQVLATPRGYHAPPETPERVANKVRKHLKSAKSHFKLGEFDKAAREWKLAYKLQPLPPLLFNIAQAYRLGGEYEEARFAYTTYLTELPDAPNRVEVQNRVRLMTRYLHHPPKDRKKGALPAPGASAE